MAISSVLKAEIPTTPLRTTTMTPASIMQSNNLTTSNNTVNNNNSNNISNSNGIPINRPIPTYYTLPQPLAILAQYPHIYNPNPSVTSLPTTDNNMSLSNLPYAMTPNSLHPHLSSHFTQLGISNISGPSGSSWSSNSSAQTASIQPSPTALVNFAAVAGLLGLSQSAQIHSTSSGEISSALGSIDLKSSLSLSNANNGKQEAFALLDSNSVGMKEMNNNNNSNGSFLSIQMASPSIALPTAQTSISSSQSVRPAVELGKKLEYENPTARNELEQAVRGSLSLLQQSLQASNVSNDIDLISKSSSSSMNVELADSVFEQLHAVYKSGALAHGSTNQIVVDGNGNFDPYWKGVMLKMLLFTLTSVNRAQLNEIDRKNMIIDQLRSELKTQEDSIKKEILSAKPVHTNNLHEEEDGPCPHCHSEKKGTRWSTADDEAMVAMIKSGKDYEEIAKQLRRTVRALKDRYCYLKKLFSSRRSSTAALVISSTRTKPARKKRSRNVDRNRDCHTSETESELSLHDEHEDKDEKRSKRRHIASSNAQSSAAVHKSSTANNNHEREHDNNSHTNNGSTSDRSSNASDAQQSSSQPHSPIPVLSTADEDSDSSSSTTSSSSHSANNSTIKNTNSTTHMIQQLLTPFARKPLSYNNSTSHSPDESVLSVQ